MEKIFKAGSLTVELDYDREIVVMINGEYAIDLDDLAELTQFLISRDYFSICTTPG